MDSYEARRDILKRFPNLDELDLDSALQKEAAETEARIKETRPRARNIYAEAIETAHDRIVTWLTEGASEYPIDFDNPAALAHFAISYRPAFVWAILMSKSFAKVENA